MSSSITSTLNSPFIGIAFMIGGMQLVKLIDIKDPKVVRILLVTYLVSQFSCLMFWFFFRRSLLAKQAKMSKADAKKEELVEVTSTPSPWAAAKAAASGQAAAVTEKKMVSTIEYDIQQAKQQMTSLIFPTIMILGIHFYFGSAQPLFMQSINAWKGIFLSHLVQVRIYGLKAEGPLKRPFKASSLFDGITGAAVAAEIDSEDSKTTASGIEEIKQEEEQDKVVEEEASSGNEASNNESSTSGATAATTETSSPTLTRRSKKGSSRRED